MSHLSSILLIGIALLFGCGKSSQVAKSFFSQTRDVNVRIVPLTAAGTYLTGNEVRFNVVFDEEVTLERSFDFAVNSGGTASCSSLSSSKEVLCSYTVSTGESSFDLDINSNTSFLDLDVVKATSDNMFLNFIPPRDHSSGALNEIGTYIVDGLDLNITSLEFASSDGSYGIGDQVLLDVHFNYDVSLTAGVVPSKFLLNTAPTQQEAIFSTIVDTNTIRYAYTVLLTDTSASLAVLSGGIFSIEGDVFSNTHGRAVTPDFSLSSTAINGSISVDGVRPLLTNITISEADGSYGLGDVINFELSFDESVRVDTTSGTPSIELETGVTDRFAVFTSGSSSSTLGFQYTVQAGDSSSDLSHKAVSSLVLNSGSLTDLAGNSLLSLDLPGPAALLASRSVVIDSVAPSISSVSFLTADGTYNIGDKVYAEVTFTENVDVNFTSGTPSLELETGTIDRTAVYTSGTGTAKLTFEYTVVTGDSSNDLDYKNTTSLNLNGGVITDGAGNNSDLTLPAVGTLSGSHNIIIDASTPTLSSLRFLSANGSYGVSSTVSMELVFDESVYVSGGGNPQLELETGTTDQFAVYSSGSGTTSLTFNYIVQTGDTSADLDYKAISSLSLNGGLIADNAGNAADLTLSAVGTLASAHNIVIDGIIPSVTNISLLESDGSYGASNSISFVLSFSKNIDVDITGGTPSIELETGVVDRSAVYSSGTGTSSLTFLYSILAGDTSSDLDYKTTNSLSLNGGTLRDSALNNSQTSLLPVGTLASNHGIVIDTTAPTLSSIQISTVDGQYGASETITFHLNFSEEIIVDTTSGIPQLELETGTVDKFATYSSGSGTSSLTFNYVVESGDSSSDLDYKATTSLSENGGYLKDAAQNSAVLTLPAVGVLAAAESIVIDAISPTISSLQILTADGTYGTSSTISFEIGFSEIVNINSTSGTPSLELETGLVDEQAIYTSGSGTSLLTFQYTVQNGNSSSDLDYKTTTSLNLNSGLIRDGASNNAVLTLPAVGTLAAAEAVVIDASDPFINSIQVLTPDGSYGVSSSISFELQFNESVFVSTSGGSPRLELETGTTDQFATFSSGSGTSNLTFEYIVNSGDLSGDLDYKATTSLEVNGGSIRDSSSNNAVLTLPAVGTLAAAEAVIIDGVSPNLSSVSITTSDGSYGVSQSISFELSFDESVYVSTAGGTPQLELETGVTDRVAIYTSGSGSSILTFEYIVQAGDISLDLDYKSINSLISNGGSIQDLSSNNAVLTLPAVGTLASVEAVVIDAAPPSLSSLLIATADGSYGVGQSINLELTFTESVFVSLGGGTPALELETGVTDRFATYTSGSGSNILTFSYTVQAGDSTLDLDYKATTSLGLSGSTIRDQALNNAVLTLPAVGTLAASEAIVVDGIAPDVDSLLISTVNGSYGVSQSISFEITFSESIFVSGTPQLELETGSTDRFANYTSGSGSSVLTFEYIVNSGDSSSDLDYKATTSLTENGGSIRDAASNDSVLTLPAVGTLAAAEAIVIDAAAPSVSSLLIATADGSYGVSQTINFELTFNESVFVSGTPQLELETGATDRFANYTSGSGSSVLTFEYIVNSGDSSNDLDYKATTSLTENSGSIRDAASNDAVLILPAVGTLAAAEAIVIDGSPPNVSSILIATADGSYGVSQSISFELTFNESVFVSGTPQLELETGATDRFANYTSGSGSSILTFEYTVVAGDTSSDLDYTSTTSLGLNGGSIKDAAMNDSVLDLPGLGTLAAVEAIVVDTTSPTISSLLIATNDGSYGVSSTISFELTFNESVFVSSAGGTPQLELETGTTDRFATYTSGSGSTVLTFQYTIEAGDSSADLDYKATTSLNSNGGSIRDLASNDSDLTLPAVGTLASSEAINIDGNLPNVSAIQILTSDGSYGVSSTISLELTFNESVFVSSAGGTPSIELETGATDKFATYTSGSGTTKLTFEYLVETGDSSLDLDYKTTTSFVLNGGSITDAASNSADLNLPVVGTLAAAEAVIVDGVQANIGSISFLTGDATYGTSASITLELDFDEVVVVSGTPSLTLETGGVDRLANFTTGSGTDKLTFEYIVNLGDTSSDLDYSSTGALSLNTGSINDEAGNSAILTLPAVGTLAAASAIVINTVTPFTFDIDFTTDSDYTVTSGSISFSGTTADLLANDQVDDADDATGFAGGTKDNVEWNGGNSGVSVSASTFNKGTNEKFLTYDSLVLYANLDEANKVDSSTITSTIGANGTLNTGDGGTNKNSTGIVNNAISFDGVDDYINFGNPAELKFEPKNDSFTAIAWIKVANGNSGVVLSRRVGTNLNYIVEVDGSGYLRCASGTASVLNTDIRVDDGAWHQVGIINDSSGTGTYGCIIDGKYYRWIRDNSIASPVTVEFLVGARNNASSGTYTDFFQGDVDEVQVWNRKLSIAEVNSMFEIKNDIVKAGHFYSRIIDAGSSQSWTTLKWRTSEPIGKDLLHSNQSEDVSSTEYGSDSITGLMTDNVLLTPFDDNTSYVGTANEVSDKSTSSNDGSASGNILVFKNLESRKGNALHIGPGFSNPKKYIDYSSPANMNWQPDTDEFTLSVWFSTIPSMNGTLFSKRAGTLEQYQVFLLSGQIGVYSGGVLYYTGAYITDNHWHHVSLRNFDDAGVKKFQVYLDGNQVGATQTSGSEMAPNAGVLLGARVQNNDGSGITFDIKPAYFEEFSAWDRALSATEILHLYKRGKNNLKFQIRSCDDDACDTEVFVGPDGTNKTYFSESSNKNGSGIPNTGAPSVDISSAVSANRYFQYRFLMETNAINSTFLNKVEVLPAQFNASNPTIFNLTSIPYQTLTSSEFVVTKSCTGTIKYQLSNDGSNWFYFNAGTWTAATDSYTDANTETEVSTSIDKFPSQVGTGNLKVKAFLNSDGSTSCTIDNIRIKGGKI
jgi:hypothetical protein